MQWSGGSDSGSGGDCSGIYCIMAAVYDDGFFSGGGAGWQLHLVSLYVEGGTPILNVRRFTQAGLAFDDTVVGGLQTHPGIQTRYWRGGPLHTGNDTYNFLFRHGQVSAPS